LEHIKENNLELISLKKKYEEEGLMTGKINTRVYNRPIHFEKPVTPEEETISHLFKNDKFKTHSINLLQIEMN
jgi:hypothetical protein